MSENQITVYTIDKIESERLIDCLTMEKENIRDVKINLMRDKEILKFLEILREGLK